MQQQCSMRSSWAVLVLMVCVAAISLPAWGQKRQESLVRKGEISYQRYCRNCHGETGKGDGPVTEYLTIEPADLTRIAERAGGAFPSSDVAAIVDGREVRAHGDTDRRMPMWGDAFQGEKKSRKKIEELVAYLESIQVQ